MRDQLWDTLIDLTSVPGILAVVVTGFLCLVSLDFMIPTASGLVAYEVVSKVTKKSRVLGALPRIKKEK